MSFYTNVFVDKGKVYCTEYVNGKRDYIKVDYEPYLFLPAKAPAAYYTVDGKPVAKRTFRNISEANTFVRDHKELAGFNFYGSTKWAYTHINDEYRGEIKYVVDDIKVITLDIETKMSGGFPDYKNPTQEITLITVAKKGKKVTFGTKPSNKKRKHVTYVYCKDELTMLRRFLILWQDDDWTPDAVTGWNIRFFDIPYLYNRIRVLLGESEANKLSPWKKVHQREVRFQQRATADYVYELRGIADLDYLELYKKFSFKNQESFKLDHIAFVELGERKLDYSQYQNLDQMWELDPDLYIDYNIHDVDLVDYLDNKLGFLQQVFAIAYDAKVNYEDTLTTVNLWDTMIHNYLLDQYIVVPQMKNPDIDMQISGGFVKDPQLGMHKWVVSFDLNSLYPHLIMQYNISPETFLGMETMGYRRGEEIDEAINILLLGETPNTTKYSIAANSAKFAKHKQGFLPALMEKVYNDRTVFKKKMIQAKQQYEQTKDKALIADIAKYHNMQMAKKIQLNSAYGALANIYFRWFNRDLAEAVTSSGRLSIQWAQKAVNQYINQVLGTEGIDYVIAVDTDSMYINMGPFVDAMFKGKSDEEIVDRLDKFCEDAIQPVLDKAYASLAEYMNAYQQKMIMKRECIASRGIWVAKKRYALLVFDEEGVRFKEPKLKIQGLEYVRSSTPSACKDIIKNAIILIMQGDEKVVIDYIKEARKKFKTLPLDQIAFPRGVSELSKYIDPVTVVKKGCPIHVRASLMYNHLIDKHKINDNHLKVMERDKIKFVYLKEPNPIHQHVIGFKDELPEEFAVTKYIDYDTQFEKGALESIRNMTNKIGWDIDKYSRGRTLDMFVM